jgi:Uncharacterized protein conserved in bacteria
MVGMVGAVWLSLRGEEVKVPDIVGKDFLQSEEELAALGLKIKRRSYRYSQEKPNTIIEQAPRAGDTVKTGQTILVVVAQANPEGTEAPAPAKKEEEETSDSSTESTEKTKKTAPKTKKPEKTRDVISNKSNKNANSEDSNSNLSNSNKSSSNTSSNSRSVPTNSSENKNTLTAPTVKPTAKPTPKPVKTPSTPNDRPAAGSGDSRLRRVP